MRLITDRPSALKDNFVIMGMVEDNMKKYGCLFDTSTGKMYVEEIYITIGGNLATAKLREIDDDQEWTAVWNFVKGSTTIFSPKKLRMVLQTAGHRGVLQIDEVINNPAFPYAMRKVDEKTHKVQAGWTLPQE